MGWSSEDPFLNMICLLVHVQMKLAIFAKLPNTVPTKCPRINRPRTMFSSVCKFCKFPQNKLPYNWCLQRVQWWKATQDHLLPGPLTFCILAKSYHRSIRTIKFLGFCTAISMFCCQISSEEACPGAFLVIMQPCDDLIYMNLIGILNSILTLEILI